MSNPFDFVNAILVNKKQLIIDDETEKEYNSFITNRALSYYLDTVMMAAEMNIRPQLDNKLQNDFLLNTIRSYKRPFAKWIKNEKNEDIECVKKYFNLSDRKAHDVVRLLSKEQIKTIKEKTDIGGVGK